MAGLRDIQNMRDGVRAFDRDLNANLADLVKKLEPEILDMNAQDQLFEKGVNSLGVEIASYEPYKPFTVEVKNLLGQPTDRVTLKDEGDFYKSFFLEVGPDSFEIKADDWKTPELQEKYRPEILGLTAANRTELAWGYILEPLMELRDKYFYGENR